MFSIESSHRGNSNEYTQYTIFNILKKITLNYPKSAAMGFFPGLKNEFETAEVNKPSVFQPLKLYCMKNLMKIVGFFYFFENICCDPSSQLPVNIPYLP